MRDNVIRFRAEPELLESLRSRAGGRSLHETARADLEEYYRILARERSAQTRERAQEALETVHRVAFAAFAVTGSQAMMQGTDGSIPLYGPEGVIQSIGIMARKGLVRPDLVNFYKKVHHTHEQLVTNPEFWSLGEVQRFLTASNQLTEEFAKFVPHERAL